MEGKTGGKSARDHNANTIYLKVHETKEGRIIAACDQELIGKILSDRNTHIDLDKHRSFYVGEKTSEAVVRKALERFHSANLIGKKATAVAVSMGLVSEEDVKYINMIPYIQVYRI